ncbi:hypothetical protein KA107_00340 [Candidatus Pacearchaeota archaeon]|nr:hypothetical protein [Candidatus Pacearchaeota archaeon]
MKTKSNIADIDPQGLAFLEEMGNLTENLESYLTERHAKEFCNAIDIELARRGIPLKRHFFTEIADIDFLYEDQNRLINFARRIDWKERRYVCMIVEENQVLRKMLVAQRQRLYLPGKRPSMFLGSEDLLRYVPAFASLDDEVKRFY